MAESNWYRSVGCFSFTQVGSELCYINLRKLITFLGMRTDCVQHNVCRHLLGKEFNSKIKTKMKSFPSWISRAIQVIEALCMLFSHSRLRSFWECFSQKTLIGCQLKFSIAFYSRLFATCWPISTFARICLSTGGKCKHAISVFPLFFSFWFFFEKNFFRLFCIFIPSFDSGGGGRSLG